MIVHYRSNQCLSIVYTMYATAFNNTSSYTLASFLHGLKSPCPRAYLDNLTHHHLRVESLTYLPSCVESLTSSLSQCHLLGVYIL